jgi:DNA-binding NarL/FixJ family response regulator
MNPSKSAAAEWAGDEPTHNSRPGISTRSNPISVAVVEDDPGYRDSLENLLKVNAEFLLVGAYPDVPSCLAGLPANPPDVLLMDIQLPDMSGIEGVRSVLAIAPKTMVVMLTAFDDSERVFESLRAGAVGYLIKRATADEILAAIKDAIVGGSPISSRIARLVVRSFQALPSEMEPPLPAAAHMLSARERELLDLLAEGLRYKEAAERMRVSLNTIRCYIRRVYEKLQANSRSQALRHYDPSKP